MKFDRIQRAVGTGTISQKTGDRALAGRSRKNITEEIGRDRDPGETGGERHGLGNCDFNSDRRSTAAYPATVAVFTRAEERADVEMCPGTSALLHMKFALRAIRGSFGSLFIARVLQHTRERRTRGGRGPSADVKYGTIVRDAPTRAPGA